MRKLIATVFNYSLDGLLADEGTDFWTFCFDLPENRDPDDPAQLDFLQNAYAHIMGRTAYEGIAASMTRTATDHPFGSRTFSRGVGETLLWRFREGSQRPCFGERLAAHCTLCFYA